MKKFHNLLLLLLFVLSLTSCSSYYYNIAQLLENHHHYLRAAEAYEKFLSQVPTGPRTAEVHVRLGNIYADLGRCLEAKRHYETELRQYGKLEPWTTQANTGMLSCPDYFPLGENRELIYGDSASSGRNMSLQWVLHASTSSAQGEISHRMMAGKKLVLSGTELYEKKEWALWENNTPILRYPFVPGKSWEVQQGKEKFVYTIESNSERVITVAGNFTDCLKVRELNKKYPNSWTYEYYAPGVGRIKTSIGGPGFENPNTELISYSTK